MAHGSHSLFEGIVISGKRGVIRLPAVAFDPFYVVGK